MVFRFEINGTPFWISHTIEGYRWMPPQGYGRLCPTLLKAQQDAMDTVQKHIDQERPEEEAEDKKYGSYEDQVESYWRSERGC